MFIQNVSYFDVMHGKHPDGDVLIQIVDPCVEFPVPKKYWAFREIHKFEFSDVERETDVAWEFRMNETQAREIATILRNAKSNNQSVIVHCIAGLCRSGAVAEVGVMIAFEDTGVYRQPNLHVKHSLMRELNLTTDYENFFGE